MLVQDSTLIELPARLFETFSGVGNATSQVCNARIQAVYGLRRIMAFEAFSIDAYRKNDLKAAPAGWSCVRATSSCATGAASARAKCCAIARPGRTSLTGTRPARSIVTRAVMKFGRIETADRTLTSVPKAKD